MRKAERLFQLVNLIRAHQPITAEQLAQRIGVSVRSIYRYIDDLSLSGIPLYGEPGRGYSLQTDFELAPLTLNQDEIAALMLGVEMLSKSTGVALAAAARSLLSKIGAVLPSHSLSPSSAALRALSEAPSGHDLRHWDRLHLAIRQKSPLLLSYLSLDNSPSQRLIYPIGLFYWGGKWTVGSWCTVRKAYRDFRLDRISALTEPNEPGAAPVEVNLDAYMRQQIEAWRQIT
ncbi:MAG: YafY family protein [Pseudomonas sp.]|uniref:helix-turn-helix transcriptional regulator n=1 Tax=Pseudomonas sp. TaxID=306 RepID=UPI00398210C7